MPYSFQDADFDYRAVLLWVSRVARRQHLRASPVPMRGDGRRQRAAWTVM